ncbi:hypothetical protein GURKE_01440 [Brevundimonas phage vB_BpoS-Gurke]|uniref:Uncharacterized protein n=1 Tax=Brevundimonas phage vB_BpoS-Gurke TaxID=2948599 RepID=A0A9E7SSP5_9CAUD|nr:hypothetical protein GURKE_01440 [Brevundimonas phage vB_BpoS-Gurke]
MASARAVFKIASFPVEGALDTIRRNHVVAECSRCPAKAKIPTPKNSGSFAPEMAQRIFRQSGWQMRNNRRKDLCPSCSTEKAARAAKLKDTPTMKPSAPTLMEERLKQAQSKSVQDKVDKSVTSLKAAAAERPKPALSVVPAATPELSKEVRYKQLCAARGRLAGICSMEKRWNKPLTEEQIAVLRRQPTETHEEHIARLEARRTELQKEHEGKEPVCYAPKSKKAAKPAAKPAPKTQSVQPAAVATTAETVRDLYEAPATPRSRSSKESRMIRDALDVHYDEDRERYQGDMSDRKLAEQLNVPAAWVSELRELNGYGPDRNAAGGEIARELETMRQALKELDEGESRIFANLTKEREAIESFQRTQFARMEEETRSMLDRFDHQTTERLAAAETRRKEIENRIAQLAGRVR